MRYLLMICAVVLAGTGPAMAQEAGIEATIRDQVEAFQAEDLARAFSHASPGIQRRFGDPQNFGAMVRDGYPMVWRPAELRFQELVERDGALWQRVGITDAAGRAYLLEYRMIESGGGWKIDAVQFLGAPAPAV